MFTKTQIRIMKLFVSQITKRFSLREVGKELSMHQALTYRASQELINKKLIQLNDGKYVLNYKDHHQELSYFEFLRNQELLNKNKKISILNKELVNRMPFDSFSLIIFGSTVISKKPNDLDLLLIIEKTEDIEAIERFLTNIIDSFSGLKVHSLVVSFESVKEMLTFRDGKNVMNEVLNKHIILYGAELFYRLLKKYRR